MLLGLLLEHMVVHTAVIDLSWNFHKAKIYTQFGKWQKAYLTTGWGNDMMLFSSEWSPKLNDLVGIYRWKEASQPICAQSNQQPKPLKWLIPCSGPNLGVDFERLYHWA